VGRRIDDQPRLSEAAPSELVEGHVEQREAEAASAPRLPEGSRMYLEAGEPNEGEPRSPSAVIGFRVPDRPTRRGTP
jgi:hypothetical protein